jgi:signal transduction histidine kinase
VNSLQGHVLRVLVGTILLSWSVALAALWLYVKHSESSIADKGLKNFATRILQAMPANTDTRFPEHGDPPKASSLSVDPKLAFQVWVDQTRMVAHTPGAPLTALKPDFVDGFASLMVGGDRWRVYSVSDVTHRKFVQVGRLQSELDLELRHKALVALGLLTVLVCFVGLLTFLAVKRSLRPVVALEDTLRRRARFDLTPLSTDALPTELQPLVKAFNHVLVQLDEAVENERRFIGDAAHELRTPLAALQAQAHVALHARSVAEKDDAIGKLITVAERNSRLSEQLLDLARLNAGENAPQRECADLSELALHVAREFEVFAETHQRKLTLDLAPAPLSCNIDEIGILLRNLVDNALRYTQQNGRVRIRCGCAHTDAGPAAHVEVADDGPGVPAGEHDAVFRRFHRVPGNGGRGSGIGLSLVAGIARLHQATITTGTGIDGRGFSVRVQFAATPPCPTTDEHL